MDKYELEDALITDLKNIGDANLVRDNKLAYRNEIKLVTPYLRWEVIGAAIKIPPEYKIKRENGKIVRKYVLRKIAEKYLPGEIAWREKRAIQYSTGISKILKKYM
jgi:asparagine synthase (glutamine-hydrolysing)